ncbi:MAG: TatD family hydrolase [Solobacterium sp.]|nr:TatD family hydrolase [Solobacterium sp.]
MSELVYLDSHCHLFSDEFDKDREAVFDRAREAGVLFLNIMCTSVEEAIEAMAYSEQDPEHIKVSCGVFPTDVNELDEETWNRFERVMRDERCTCIGEIGLDYYWEKEEANRAKQRELFIRQIALANEVNKPICVHSRDAIQDTFDIMKEHRCHGLMHSFSGSEEMGKEFVKLGYYLSLGGPVTFKNARHAREVVTSMDVSYLLSETDSPYMAPEPVRGTRNEPANIPYITARMAECRGVSTEELSKQIIDNWHRFLELK